MNIRQLAKPAGQYSHYSNCRLCLSKEVKPVLSLDYVPLAGGFLKKEDLKNEEKFYPLDLSFCTNCFLLQSSNVIHADTLFKEYFYRSSAIKTLTTHFTTFTEELSALLDKNHDPFIVEVGCNDGTIINELTMKNINVLGVDPATNIVTPLIKNGLPIINDYFSEKIAKKIKKKFGMADAIISFNTFAHIEDMHDVVKGIKILLGKTGVFIFEVHYLGKLIKELQYDMIYHEHQYYYSLMTLKKFFEMYDLEIFDVRPIQIHAGSMRYYVKHRNDHMHSKSDRVTQLLEAEKKQKLDRIETFDKLARSIEKTKKDLLTLLNALKRQNKTIAGYGASGRGTILANYCGLDRTYLEYVIDDSPAKTGAYMPGTHQKIHSSDILMTEQKPDYVLLFAWSFWEEIKKRNELYLQNGGKFILPLPRVTIVPDK